MTTTGKVYTSVNVVKWIWVLREGSCSTIARNLIMCMRQVVKVYLIYLRGVPVEIGSVCLLLHIKVLNYFPTSIFIYHMEANIQLTNCIMAIQQKQLHLRLPAIKVLFSLRMVMVYTHSICRVYTVIFSFDESLTCILFLTSVTFSIKSFTVPELYIEMPETATVGYLKV